MKLQSFIRWMVLAAVVLVAAHAFAAPVNLLCEARVQVTFDEDRGTASFSGAPASVASFTATTIKWSIPGTDALDYNLDRISGILRVSFFCLTCMDPKLRQTYSETCVVAEKKF
jgi:hypothetical protein